VLGLAGAAGFLLGGILVTFDLAGFGWRAVFFVNVPFGAIIMAAAWKIMPMVPRRAGTRLDIPGAIVLFVGLLCLIGPLLFGHDVGWSPWVWLAMAAGIAIIAAFLRLERAVARRGGMPLIDLALLTDKAFMRGLAAVFFFFFANLSFYLVMTMFMQKGLQIPPLQAGLVFLPLALTFVVASRHSGVRAKYRGTLVLIEGCAVQALRRW
jgi:predicted MFS family arabinose efflux permease